MDCLHNLLPEELVSLIQKYTSHQICDDKYFKYCKNFQIHSRFSNDTCPKEMLELFVCYFNQEFIGLVNDVYISSPLIRKLQEDNHWVNTMRGNNKVVHYTYAVANTIGLDEFTVGYNESHNKGFTLSGELSKVKFEYAWMMVYSWLTKLVEENNKYKKFSGRCFINFKSSLPHLPSMKNSKADLQELLTNNGLKWYKTWSRKKLLQKWYKSKD